MTTYRTFKRSCTNWEQFSKSNKMTVNRGLSLEKAREDCDLFNNNRTSQQIRRGTKMEFEQE